jgi:hypothetical protein
MYMFLAWDMYNIKPIHYYSKLKFLGLFITENLTWHAQIYSLCVSLSKIYYMIKSLRYSDDMEYIFLIFSVKIKVWNYVLGRRWKIYKDIRATKKGYSTNYSSK